MHEPRTPSSWILSGQSTTECPYPGTGLLPALFLPPHPAGALSEN